MRFECYAKHGDTGLVKLVKGIHNDKDSHFDWEVVASLRLSNEKEIICIEYQVLTGSAIKTIDVSNWADYFTAYLVDDEDNYQCDREIDCIDVDRNGFSTVQELKDAMYKYAERLLNEDD